MFKKQANFGSAGSKLQNANSNRKKTARLFNVQNQSTNSFLKASDVLLNPFSMSERKNDHASEKQLRMPKNPSRFSQALQGEKPLQTFTQFCKLKNIPFNMNEKRFYQIAKHEYSKNSWYYALAHFFHQIDIRGGSVAGSSRGR